MLKKNKTAALIILSLVGVLVLGACSNTIASNAGNPSNQPAPKTGRIKATWITPGGDGNNTVIPVSEITKNVLIHFLLDDPSGKMPFMVYEFEGKTYVRANICPPCRSYNYDLDKDILVCTTCGSRFAAKTGDGVSGP